MKRLLLACLLLHPLGCAKKEDAVVSNVGSYTLDGTLISCQAKATVSSSAPGNVPVYDYLEIDLTTTPEPASGPQVAKLYFLKPTGQPSSAYVALDFPLYVKGSTSPYYFSNNLASFTPTSGGGFTGSFSAKIYNAAGSAPAPYFSITNGVFTDVRP